jgi:hypothetical protein
MQPLAIDTQSFEDLRNNGCVYVDKTVIIYRMITVDGFIFFYDLAGSENHYW